MRIVYDHQIVGSQEFGGASRYVFELASRMATTHGQDVTVVSPLFANSYLKTAPDSLNVIGVPIPRIPRTGRVVLALNSLLVRPIIRLLNPDLVHETYYSHRPVAPPGARVVLTVYDMIHEKFQRDFPANDPTRQEKAAAVERADHIICISEQTREDLIDLLRVEAAKTSVVHLGFALTNQNEPIKTLVPSPARPFLLYVGHRGGYKNFAGLLRAYAASPMLQRAFDLVCFGGGAFRTSEVRAMRDLGLSSERIRQRFGDDPLLAAHYRSAAALVYPSLYEGFGIPPLEAMSLGCPVICSGVSSTTEVVGEAGEMFDPYQTESIRAAIERVVSDDERRKRLIALGRERIEGFSWRRCAEQTFDVYSRVLAGEAAV